MGVHLDWTSLLEGMVSTDAEMGRKSVSRPSSFLPFFSFLINDSARRLISNRFI